MVKVSDDVDVVNPTGRWGKHFTWMHRLEEGMTLRQLRVWCVIVTHANERGECWPAVGTVAGLTGMTDRQVRQAVADLVLMGVLVRVQRGNASSIMRIVRPADGYAPNRGRVPVIWAPLDGPEVCPELGQGVCPESGQQNRPLNIPHDDGSSLSSIQTIGSMETIVHLEMMQDDARAMAEPARVEPSPAAHPEPEPTPVDVSPAAAFAPQRALDATPTPTHAPEMETHPGAAQAVLWATDTEAPDGVTRLHALWQRVVDKPGWGLTPKRHRAFAALLRAAGSMGRAENAIRGLGLSDWHMGRDPKTNGAQYVEPELITRNLDRFVDLQAASEADRPEARVTWDQLNSECMRAYVDAVRGITDHVDAAVKAGTLDPLTDKQRASFDPLLQPMGMVTWDGERVHVFQWRHDDGTPDNPRTMLFIKSINRAAALVGRRRMMEKWPGSKVVDRITTTIVTGTKQEALDDYAAALAVMRERVEDEKHCIVGDLVFLDGTITGVHRPTGDMNHAPTR